MSEIIKKIIIIIIVILAAVGMTFVVTSLMFSDNKKSDKDYFADEHTVFVKETTPTDAEKNKATDSDSEPVAFVTSEPEVTSEEALEDITGNASAGDAISHEKYQIPENTNDTQAPVIFINNTNVTITLGTTFNIKDYIGYGDDVDRDVEVITEASVNTSVTGSYKVNYKLRDDAGHETPSVMNVNVVDSVPDSEESGLQYKAESFADFAEKYKTDNTSLGIDVSRWQSSIDFQKVKEAGCEFVIIRIGGYDDGNHYTDKFYAQNIRNAKAAGLKVGIYWHAEESTPDEVRSSVNYMMGVLDNAELDFPIAYDWEDFAKFEEHHMNIQDLNDCYEVFVDEVNDRGYTACLYNSKNFLDTVWKNERNNKVWLAHYTDKTDYTGEYYMWQHSSIGRIPGIDGAVDLDILYK